MTKHTPWRMEIDPLERMAHVTEPDGRPVAIVDVAEPEQMSAAHLIIAAPDLLDALEAILPWHDSHPAEPTDNPLIAKCRAAIAKAKGKA